MGYFPIESIPVLGPIQPPLQWVPETLYLGVKRQGREAGHSSPNSNSKLSTSNKLLIYKTMLKPICTHGIQLWGTASTSNIEILERFQSKALRMIVDAPWYVPNTVIRRDIQTPTVTEEIRRYSSQYSARLSAHPNDLIVNLMELPDNKTPVK
jgi:hypothetical protein